jgi:hypothetical protein
MKHNIEQIVANTEPQTFLKVTLNRVDACLGESGVNFPYLL